MTLVDKIVQQVSGVTCHMSEKGNKLGEKKKKKKIEPLPPNANKLSLSVHFCPFWYRCYYPHRSRDSVSPVCGILFFGYNTFDLLGMYVYHYHEFVYFFLHLNLF